MPIFEYRCQACETSFEKLLRSSDKVDCPACGSRRVEKLISIPARPASGTTAGMTCESMPQGGCCGGGMCQPN